MIAKITDAYVRHYSDNGDTKAYVEWIDTRGRTGRTEGDGKFYGNRYAVPLGFHMEALFARAQRELGRPPRMERW